MLIRVPLTKIDDNPYQTRKFYKDIEELAASIYNLAEQRPDTSGLLQVPVARIMRGEVPFDPVLFGDDPAGLLSVLEDPTARVQLAFGHRRRRAFDVLVDKYADYETLPVDIAYLDAQTMADIAWEENKKRSDLSPVEAALAIQQGMDKFGWTQGDVGQRWGLSQGAVSNLLRLLRLPEEVQARIQDGQLSERHGRALLPLVDLGVAAAVMLSLALDGEGNPQSSGYLEVAVEGYLSSHTANLAQARWADDWIPGRSMTDDFADIAQACRLCPQRLEIGRRKLCGNMACFERKQVAHQQTLAGPERARELHTAQGHATFRRVQPESWQACWGCERKRQDFNGTPYAKSEWYKGRMYTDLLCPECWERARLPEILETPATPVAVYTAAKPTLPPPTAQPYYAQSQTVAAGGLRIPAPDGMQNSGPAVATPPDFDGGLRIAAPVAHSGNGADEGDVEDDGDAESSIGHPANGVVTSPMRTSVRIIPPPAPARVSEPLVTLKANIYPGTETVLGRRVTISIGPEGSGPTAFRSGTLAELAQLIGEVLQAQFGAQLAAEQDEILVEEVA